jgi:hypothetical protein
MYHLSSKKRSSRDKVDSFLRRGLHKKLKDINKVNLFLHYFNGLLDKLNNFVNCPDKLSNDYRIYRTRNWYSHQILHLNISTGREY